MPGDAFSRLTNFNTTNDPCAIIKGRDRVTESFENIGRVTEVFNARAFAKGYRALGNYYSRDHCISCLACKPSRVLAQEFSLNDHFRKVMRKNADITMTTDIMVLRIDEHHPLYLSYMQKHRDTSNEKVTEAMQNPAHFEKLLTKTNIIEFRNKERQLLGALTYQRGLHSVYGNRSYYDLDASKKRSLGTYMLLCFIERARLEGKDYVYLGSATPNDKTAFSYKTQFTPLEIMNRDGTWQRLDTP